MLRKIVNARVTWTAAVVAAGCTLGLLPGPVLAQTFQPPLRNNVDQNGVDLINLNFTLSTTEVSIGVPGEGGMAYARSNYGAQSSWTDNYTGAISVQAGSTATVSIGSDAQLFVPNGINWQPGQGQGSQLTYNSANQTYTFIREDGTVAIFNVTGNDGAGHSWGVIASITFPRGETQTFHYLQGQLCTGTCDPSFSLIRLQSVTNNYGYQIRFNYQIGGSQVPYTGVGLWQTVIGITGINMAVDYCDPMAQSCSYSVTWPSVTYTYPDTNTQTVTDALSRVTTYLYSGGQLTGVRKPSNTSTNRITIAYDSTDHVTSVTNGTGTWVYSPPSDNGDQRTVTVTDPLQHTRTVVSSKSMSVIQRDTNGAGKTAVYTYDATGRLLAINLPEGGSVQFQYDWRGNTTQTCFVPKARANQPCDVTQGDIVSSAHFADPCYYPVWCNKPDYTIDERGNETDYTYDNTHGGLLTVTFPAPLPGAVRPQTRNTYTPLYAWYKNSNGVIAQAPTPVYQVTQISSCATLASCTGGTDELRTTIGYGSDGVANNRLPTSITKSDGAGTAAVTATTTTLYDAIGNPISVDGPLPGSSDTIVYRYDAVRQRIGIVGPDPDDSGPLKIRAKRITYDVDGNVTAFEQGTVADMTDASWGNFSTLKKDTTTYDGLDRPIQKAAIAVPGGSPVAVTQLAYDAENHLTCAAQRMNSSVFSSLPDACTLSTTGADGPDRIIHYTYDSADRLFKTTVGYGGAAPIDAMTLTYTDDGLRSTVADGAGHLSTFEYDGFDRLYKLHYPDPTTGSVSSATDYEQFGYDAASNMSQIQRRDGQLINLGYDAMNRLYTKAPPAAADGVTYGYDNLGRMVSAATPGETLSFTFDALGHLVNQVSPQGTWVSGWDVAGRRTQLTWPDGFFVNYDYDNDNEVTKIRENNASSGVGVLATFAYDDLGRRQSLSRGNGVTTTYGYDSISRLSSLTQDLTGTANDQTYTIGYNAVSQINHETTTNTIYDWNGTPPNASHTANGQNQLIGGGLTYTDQRGNLTSDGTTTYTFDAQNRLTSASGSPAATLSYDPEDRLYQTVGATTTLFAYDGSNLAGEYSGSTQLRRYIYGPRQDEPLVWYEGTGTTDRRWLVADVRGSVIAVTDGTGTATQIDQYDDYGVPGTSNPGRFQYTGQTWLPEVGLYYFKARVYHPRLGRFLQTDPTGYVGGLNLYAYAANDPVNMFDPTGFDECGVTDNTVTVCGTPGDCGVTDDTVTVCGTPDPGPPNIPTTDPPPNQPTEQPPGPAPPSHQIKQGPSKTACFWLKVGAGALSGAAGGAVTGGILGGGPGAALGAVAGALVGIAGAIAPHGGLIGAFVSGMASIIGHANVGTNAAGFTAVLGDAGAGGAGDAHPVVGGLLSSGAGAASEALGAGAEGLAAAEIGSAAAEGGVAGAAGATTAYVTNKVLMAGVQKLGCPAD